MLLLSWVMVTGNGLTMIGFSVLIVIFMNNVGTAIAQWPPAQTQKLPSQAEQMPKEEASKDDILTRVQPLMAEVDSILETFKK